MRIRHLLALATLILATGAAWAQDKVLNHIDNAQEQTLAALRSRGVSFEVCEIMLKNRGLKKDHFIEEADFTPSGVVRITRLQQQGYAYLKP